MRIRHILQSVLVSATVPLLAMASGQADASGPGSLRDFFASQGFAGAPLHRRLGNHLFVSSLINNRHTALMIDTGAPFTLIDRNSINSLGLRVEKTTANIGGVFGWSAERYGVSKLTTLVMGNCTLTNVPV